MTATRWSGPGRARRILARNITGFNAILPCRHPGISFSARMEGSLFELDSGAYNPVRLATAIRLVLRGAARDITCRTNPADLAEATDMCNQRLAVPLPVPSYPKVRVTATVTLSLSGDNQRAVNELVAACRKQDILDLSRRQRASAIRDDFADPASALSWWLTQEGESISRLPKAMELTNIVDTVMKYPRTTNYPIEYQILDLLRAFVAEFPDQQQKQALLTLLSNGFRRAGAAGLADQAENLASSDASSNGTRPEP